MNVRTVYNYVAGDISNLEFEIKEVTDDKIIFISEHVSCDDYDDDVYMKIVAFKSGYFHVFLTFDKLEKNFYNYDLINEFNAASSTGSAYIREDGYLELHYNDTGVDDRDAADSICNYLTDIFNDDVKEYLLPLTRRTHD